MGSSSELQRLENRHLIRSVAEVILLCAMQGIALRGHREESSDAANTRGNFLEIIHLVGRHDKVVATRLADGPKNAKYTSHMIQDDILHIMANLLTNCIIEELKAAEYFAVLVDESRDTSKKEQLSICVRYYLDEVINELFFNFIKAEHLDSESVLAKILEVLFSFGMDTKLA